MNKKSKIDQEMVEIESNSAALAVHKEKAAKAREDVKHFWKSQLTQAEEQK